MDLAGEDEWSDWNDEELPAKSLLEDRMFPSAQDALLYDKDTYGFDLLALRTELGLDFYGCVKLVNYVRMEVKASEAAARGDRKAAASEISRALLSSMGAVLADERYLRPAQADDAVLLGLEELLLFEDRDEGDVDGMDGSCLDDDLGEEEKKTGEAGIWPKEWDGSQKEVSADAMGMSNSVGQVTDASAKGAVALQGEVGGEKGPGDGDLGDNGIIAGERVGPAQSSKLDEVERENNQLREALEEMQRKMERASHLLRGLVGGGDQDGRGGRDTSDGAKGASSVSVGGIDNDSYYFRGYAHWGVHETMLTDRVRTGGYEQAICGNPEFFKGKVVLDVGCGTGVLSCFAARAGAAKVIGVDRSDIVLKAREVVRDNGFDGIVHLIQGKIEEVDIEVKAVDVIISEWMGYCLFYESMLPSVLFAREKYLVDGGVMLPDRTPLFIQAWRDPDRRLEFWKDVHGLDYSSMAELPLDEASVEVVHCKDTVTERCLCQDFNTETVKEEELDFEAPFEMTMTSPGPISGWVISFDTGFFAKSDPPPSVPHPPPSPPPLNEQSQGRSSHTGMGDGGVGGNRGKGVVGGNVADRGSGSDGRTIASWFSTGPESPPTHWKQTLLWLRPSDAPKWLDVGDGVSGLLMLSRNEVNHRELSLRITWSATRRSSGETFGGSQSYAVC